MAQYVKVNLDLLATTATRLGQVADALAGARSSADADAAAVGHPDLAGALSDFSDNWRIRRETLTEAVRGAQQFVGGAHEAYCGLDRALAEAITPEGGGK